MTETTAGTGLPRGDDLPLKVKLAVYGAGLFSNSISNMMNIVVPLWALALDPTPLTLGLILGARSFLPLLLAIHGGALMDRIGTRRVICSSPASPSSRRRSTRRCRSYRP